MYEPVRAETAYDVIIFIFQGRGATAPGCPPPPGAYVIDVNKSIFIQCTCFAIYGCQVFLCVLLSDQQCTVPSHFRGEYYSLESTEGSNDLITTILERGIEVAEIFSGRCVDYEIIPDTADAQNRSDIRILFEEPG